MSTHFEILELRRHIDVCLCIYVCVCICMYLYVYGLADQTGVSRRKESYAT